MKNSEVVIKRIGSNLPYGARSADWIVNGQMIIVSGKVIQRRLLASLFCTADGKQFLKVDVDETAESEYKCFPGVHFKLSQGAHVTGLDWPCFKAGIHNLRGFINICGRRHVMENDDGRWERRKMVMRAISELYPWFVPGVYEIQFQESTGTKHLPGLIADPHPVRSADFASGKVTSAEHEKLKAFVEQWKSRARRTTSLDKAELTSAINHLYSSFNLKPPKIVFTASPLEMIVTGLLSIARSDNSKLGAEARNSNLETIEGIIAKDIYAGTVQIAFHSIRDMLDSQTAKEFEKLIDQCRGTAALRSMYGPSGYAVECAIKEAMAVLNQVNFRKHEPMAEMLKGAEKKLRDQLLFYLEDYWQFHDYGNTMRYDELLTSALREVLGIRFPVDEQLVAWQAVAANCGATLMHEEFCFVSDFPETVNMDEEGRPHNEFASSVRWRDGWEIYHWHGTRIPGRFVEAPETITVADIRSEQNLEVRRVLLEFYGLKRFLVDSEAEEVHRDEYGVLYSVEFDPHMDAIVMVKVKNSTAEPDGSFKDYFLIVPPNTSTAKAAVAWTFGVTADEYCPLVQT